MYVYKDRFCDIPPYPICISIYIYIYHMHTYISHRHIFISYIYIKLAHGLDSFASFPSRSIDSQ